MHPFQICISKAQLIQYPLKWIYTMENRIKRFMIWWNLIRERNLSKNYVLFSSPAPKAQVSFSDQNVFVVRRCRYYQCLQTYIPKCKQEILDSHLIIWSFYKVCRFSGFVLLFSFPNTNPMTHHSEFVPWCLRRAVMSSVFGPVTLSTSFNPFHLWSRSFFLI